MATTYVSLGGVPLDVGPLRFSLYRGWDVREQVIEQSTLRFAEFDAVFKQSPAQPLVIDDGSGGRARIPVRILRIDPVDADTFNIVVTDTRMDAVRVLNLVDLNIIGGTQTKQNAAGEVVEFTRSFLRDSNTLRGGTSPDTINALDAVILLFATAKREWKADKIYFEFDNAAVVDRLFQQRVPVNLELSGLTLLDALRRLLGPYEIDLWVDADGGFVFLNSDSSAIPAEYAVLPWVDSEPPFAQKIGGYYYRPKKFILPYQRREEISLELPQTVPTPGVRPKYLLEQTYKSQLGKWLDFEEFPVSLRAAGGFATLTEAYVAPRFFSDTWEGTPYQTYEDATAMRIAGVAEAVRVPFALYGVGEIKTRYRRNFRVKFLPPFDLAAAVSAGLWNEINERGHWYDLRFGSIRIPGVSSPDVAAEANAAGETKDEHALRMVHFADGPAVYCNWIDFLATPDINRAEPLKRDGIVFARNNTAARGIPPAPFLARWEDEDSFVIDVAPLAGYGITDRMPGLLAPGALKRLAIAEDPGHPNAEQVGADLIHGADTPEDTVPALQESPRIVVKMTGTRRLPIASRKRYFEVEVDGFADGNVDLWVIPVDPTKFALFSDGDPSNPANPNANPPVPETDPTIPVNLASLRADAERRVAQLMRRVSGSGVSSATCDGLGAALARERGAVSEIVIDIGGNVGTKGAGVVSTTVQVGGFPLGAPPLNLPRPLIAGGAAQ